VEAAQRGDEVGAAGEEAGEAAKGTRLLSLFERDPDRFNGFSVRLGDMLLDFSKTAIDARALTLLIELAAARGVPERRDLMFTGAKINTTEGRAVLHVALRNRSGKPMRRRILPKGKDNIGKGGGVAYEDMRWSRLKNKDPATMFSIVSEHVFPFLRNMAEEGTAHATHMKGARFTIPTPDH